MNNLERYKKEVSSLHPSEDILKNIENSKQKKKTKKYYIKTISSIAAVFIVVLLAGGTLIPALFGAKSADRAEISAGNGSPMENTAASDSSGLFDSFNYTADEEYKDFVEEDGVSGTPLKNEENGVMIPVDNRKLIKDAYLSVETKTFDDFYSALEQSVKSLGGYTESSDITVSSYDNHRFGDIILRIPSDSLDSFLNTVSGTVTVTSQKVSVRDVTSTYIDAESRIAALETEMSTLLELLKKAEALSDVLEIQSRLTSVRADLEFMKSQLNTLNNQISYSTVTLSVVEVKREQPVMKEGFFSEVYSRLRENFYSVSDSLREGAIWFISSVPYFILILIPVAIIIITVRIIRRRRIK